MNLKKTKVLLNKGGRNKNSISARVTIPQNKLEDMQITKEDKDIIISFKRREMLISSSAVIKYYKKLEKKVLLSIYNETFETNLNCWTLKNLEESKSYFYGYKDALQFLQENNFLQFKRFVIEIIESEREYFQINIRFEDKKPELTEKGINYLETIKKELSN